MPSAELSLPQHIVPLYFGPEGRLFGVLNPASGPAERGVLICAPLGYENVIYHRQLAVLARRIAAKGAPTFRFDWPGVGDSAGDDDDPDLVPRSLASVQHAVDVLRERAQVERVDVVGLRFGATLACAAVGATEGAADLVLWDPFASGRSYLRNLRAFERLSGPQSRDGGAESAAGFLLTPEVVSAIEGLDLKKCELGPARRILIAHREGMAPAGVADRFAAAGHEVTEAVLEGLREVALGWAERPVPIDSFETIEDWLSLPKGRPPGFDEVHAPTVPYRPGSMLLEDGVVEQPVLLGAGSPMLGITTMTQPPAADDGSWVVFIPNRYARRIGPNGLYRRWARNWAKAGVPSFRVDVNGTGDAGGPDGETDRDMYQRDGVRDVLRGLSFLRDEYQGQRAAVIGLCSGGYLGFHAALEDEMVSDVFLLNPQLLLWADYETALNRGAAIRTRLLRRRSWSRFFRNPITWSRFVLPVLREVVVAERSRRKGRDPGVGTRERPEPIEDWIRRSVRALGERGCHLHFIFSEGDSGIGYLARYLGADMPGLADQAHVTFHVIEGANHSFTDLDRQAELHDLIASVLASRGYRPPEIGTSRPGPRALAGTD